MMKWLKITVSADPSAEELVSNVLMEAGAQGVQIAGNESELSRDVPVTWDVGEVTDSPDGFSVSAYFSTDNSVNLLDGIRSRLEALKASPSGDALGSLETAESVIDDEDWTTAWKEYFKPVRAADFIVVKPTWSDYDSEPGQVVIDIDPGMAFGTGNHESTRLALTLIEKFVCPGDCVVDVGSGSGVLAITAAKMGASPVYALDSDPVAVAVTAANAAVNDAHDIIQVMQSDLFSALPEGIQADVVVCNIVADVIIRLAPQIPGVLRENGMFLCSGTIRDKCGEVIEALSSANLRIISIMEDNEWVAMACKYKR